MGPNLPPAQRPHPPKISMCCWRMLPLGIIQDHPRPFVANEVFTGAVDQVDLYRAADATEWVNEMLGDSSCALLDLGVRFPWLFFSCWYHVIVSLKVIFRLEKAYLIYGWCYWIVLYIHTDGWMSLVGICSGYGYLNFLSSLYFWAWCCIPKFFGRISVPGVDPWSTIMAAQLTTSYHEQSATWSGD